MKSLSVKRILVTGGAGGTVVTNPGSKYERFSNQSSAVSYGSLGGMDRLNSLLKTESQQLMTILITNPTNHIHRAGKSIFQGAFS